MASGIAKLGSVTQTLSISRRSRSLWEARWKRSARSPPWRLRWSSRSFASQPSFQFPCAWIPREWCRRVGRRGQARGAPRRRRTRPWPPARSDHAGSGCGARISSSSLERFALQLLRALVGPATQFLDLALHAGDLGLLFGDLGLQRFLCLEPGLVANGASVSCTFFSTVSSTSRLASSSSRCLRRISVWACWASASFALLWPAFAADPQAAGRAGQDHRPAPDGLSLPRLRRPRRVLP